MRAESRQPQDGQRPGSWRDRAGVTGGSAGQSCRPNELMRPTRGNELQFGIGIQELTTASGVRAPKPVRSLRHLLLTSTIGHFRASV